MTSRRHGRVVLVPLPLAALFLIFAVFTASASAQATTGGDITADGAPQANVPVPEESPASVSGAQVIVAPAAAVSAKQALSRKFPSAPNNSGTAELSEALGNVSVGGRIVEGFEATPGRYTYMANVLERDDEYTPFCGGTLIAPKVVLTAAHCIDEYDWKVYIGRHHVFEGTAGVHFEEIDVVKKVPHPKYNINAFGFDVMLLKLATASVVTPVLIDGAGSDKLPKSTNKRLRAMGWGDTENYRWGTFPTLQAVMLKYLTNRRCKDAGMTGGVLESNMMCALRPGKDTCQGDSGGPLIAFGRRAELDIQVGVTSWGYGCAESTPGVYHRVSQSHSWIKEKVEKWGQSLREFIVCEASMGSILKSNGDKTAQCKTDDGTVVGNTLTCATKVITQSQDSPSVEIATCKTTDNSNLQTYSDPVSQKCCSDFPKFSDPSSKGSAGVCGGTRLPGGQGCQSGTYDEAKAICEDAGARLCTLQELEDGETKGTGCGLDEEQVWTSTKCATGPDRWINAKGKNAHRPDCDRPSKHVLGVRCCADVC